MSKVRQRTARMPSKNKTARAHAVVYVTAEIFKKKREKENQHAISQVQFTLCLLLELECLLCVCLFVRFLSATRHLSTLRRCLRVAERAGAVVARGPARRAGASMHNESTLACRTTSQRENRCADAFQKTISRTRARMMSYT